jgi:hypothetical protein
MVVCLVAALPTIENNSCCKLLTFTSNNLNVFGKLNLATALSVLTTVALLCKVQLFFCAIAACSIEDDRKTSNSFFIISLILKVKNKKR